MNASLTWEALALSLVGMILHCKAVLVQTYLCQECGIEVVVLLGAGAQADPAHQESRRSVFKRQYMYHTEMEDGTTKFSSKKLKEAVCTASSFKMYLLTAYAGL
jgi:hypothetical protein